jgi:hypothetical protein
MALISIWTSDLPARGAFLRQNGHKPILRGVCRVKNAWAAQQLHRGVLLIGLLAQV